MKKISWFEVVLFLGILFSHTYVALSPEKILMNWFRIDDAYYYFNTAKNITNGLGVTFDGINATNGFHPLWMLICIPVFFFARYNLYLPFRILVILLGVLNAGSAILLYRWISKELTKNAGMLAAIIWAFSPLIHSETSMSGLETGLSVFFFILLIKLVSESIRSETKLNNGRLVLIGSVAAMVFLSRLDNIFVILMVGIWFVFGRSEIRYHLALDAIFIMLAGYASLLLRLGNFIDIYQFSSELFIFIGLGLIIKIPILFFTSLYQPKNLLSIGKLLRNLCMAILFGEVITSLPLILLSFSKTGFSFPKSLPIYDLAITIILMGGSRIFLYFSREQTTPSQTPIQLLKENWNSWSKNIAYYFGILIVVMFFYISINQFFFLTPLPVSGQIKQWWGTMYTVYGIPARTFSESLGFSPTYWTLISNILTFPGNLIPTNFMIIIYFIEFSILAALILGNQLIAKQAIDRLLLQPILGGCFWQIWSYNMRSYVSFKDWYWATQLLLTVLILVLVFHLLQNKILEINKNKTISSGLLVFFSLVILISYTSSISKLMKVNHQSASESDHLFGVSFLENNTEPGSSIGLTGGGTVAYFIQDRTIINLDGLINSSEYFQALKDYRAAEFLDKIGLDYVFALPFIIQQSEPYKDEFPNRLGFISNYESYALYQYFPAP